MSRVGASGRPRAVGGGRAGRRARVLAAGLAVALAPLGCARPAGFPTPPGARTRVMTYNIQSAQRGLGGVVTAIRSAAPDMVGLEEVDVHWGERSGWVDEARALADSLGMHVFFAPIYTEPPPVPGQPPRQFGVAILTRFPVVRELSHELTRHSTQDTTVVRPMPGFAEVDVRIAGGEVRLFDTHLDYRADPAVRRVQVAETLRILDGLHVPTILMGDLNATPDAPELQPLFARLQDAWQGHTDPGYTWPSDVPRQRIDYILLAGGVGAFDARVPDTQASDHRPLVAEVALPGR